MKSTKNTVRSVLNTLRHCDSGAVTIEFAFALTALTLLVVGVVNMGLAYSAQMSLSNAVRAGSQFALVRHPSLAPGADAQQAIVSMQDIRNAVVQSADFLAADPGAPDLTACVFYECPSAAPTPCGTTPGGTPACAEWQTFVSISLSRLYDFLIPFPVFGSGVTLSATHTVRLN